ncbi:MAG: hypothetical protein G01um10148_345 [Parcubacteria group bacterium Gr01-1014_8]|nr:MAG: hypothetical protein G01um10148_345 [Parcubacteria group bacterium Gr01-1014_8]
MVVFGLLAIFSGVIAASGILFPSIWLVSVFGLIPFAHVLHRLQEKQYRDASILGLLFGFAYSGTAIAWFWDVLPLDWTGSPPWKGIIFVGFSWLMVTLVLAVFFSLFAAGFVRSKRSGFYAALLAASLWTVLQYAQMWGFAILTARDLSFSGPHFSPTMLGYSLTNFSPFLRSASIGGIYILTFLAVFLGFSLYHVIFQYENARKRGLVFALILSGALTLAALDRAYSLPSWTFQNESGSVRVALVSTSMPVTSLYSLEVKRKHAREVAEYIRIWAKENEPPDIIVFPEATDFFVHSNEDPTEFAKLVFPDHAVTFIDSGPVRTGSERYVQMRMYENGTLMPETYRKIFLVPQGEYTPWLFAMLLRLIGVSDAEQSTMRERSVASGTKLFPAHINGTEVGALFCSDILSPNLYQKLAQGGARVFVNPAGQAWFHGSHLVDNLVLSLGKVRAVENDRYIAIAGNGLASSIVTNRGKVEMRSDSAPSILAASVPLKDTKTLYSLLGEYVLILPILSIVFLIIRKREVA